MVQSALAQLSCPHCRAKLSARMWPKSGNAVPSQWESEGGPRRLLITCPRCKHQGYVAWSADPGPLQDSNGRLLAAEDLVAEAADMIKSGELPQAFDRLEWAIMRDPKHVGARQCLAVAFGKVGNLTEAIAQLKLALQIEPHLPGAHYNLGALYYKQGKNTEAVREMETALELDPEYQPAQMALQKILGAGSVLGSEEIPSGATMILRSVGRPGQSTTTSAATSTTATQALSAAPTMSMAATVPAVPSSETPKPLPLKRQFMGHDQDVRALAFAPLGSLLISGSTDATVRIWDYLPANANTARLNVRMGFSVAGLSFTTDGDKLAVAGGLHIRIWLLDRNALKSANPEPASLMRHEWKLTLPPPERRVTCAAFSPDGKVLVTGNECRIDGEYAAVWNVGKAELKQTLPGDFEANALAFSPGGRWLAVSRGGKSLGAVDLWNADAWTTGGSFPSGGRGVAFSNDGHLLAVPHAERGVQLWQVESGQKHLTLAGPQEGVTCLAFSPDGRYLASGGKDNQVLLWNVQTGQLAAIAVLATVPGVVESVAFSPDSSVLAAAGSNFKILVWELPK